MQPVVFANRRGKRSKVNRRCRLGRRALADGARAKEAVSACGARRTRLVSNVASVRGPHLSLFTWPHALKPHHSQLPGGMEATSDGGSACMRLAVY